MKLNIFWNVYDNYFDSLLGSEIIYNLNKEYNSFEELKLYSQGGYHVAPEKHHLKYLEEHFNIEINENHELIKIHQKYKGVLRVLNGIKNAYKVSLKNNADFAIVTNADSWFLDIEELKNLLNQENTLNNSISMRVGIVSGLEINYGDYIPFFDDHFMILNINLCKKHKVFEHLNLDEFNPHFVNYGGIHYMIGTLLDQIVPQNQLNIYTNLLECVNHYGERSGFSLLPWQYDPNLSFLHANCHQEDYLNYLRASILKQKGLDNFVFSKAYCNSFKNHKLINSNRKFVYFKKTIKNQILFLINYYPIKLYHLCLFFMKFKKFSTKKSLIRKRESSEITFFKKCKDIVPLAIVSRL
tara:strand:+ start:251 stop:1315 length:1065 start_codon:yes stop_codon:yes gene_type:complete